MTPVPRRRGRPRKPDDQKAKPRSVKLGPKLDDALCRLSNNSGVSIHALIRRAVATLCHQAAR
jgi:hypothetical protein